MTCIKTSFRILFHPSFHESRPVVLCVHRIFLSPLSVGRSVEKELYRKYCVYVQTERSYIYFMT